MNQTMAYKVVITTSKGLNILLTNKNPENLRSYCHFVSCEDAERFALQLREVLENAVYSDLDHCYICSKPFFREDGVYRLTNGKPVHKSCFRRECQCNRMNHSDSGGIIFAFPHGTPQFDFTNMGDKALRFQYAIQVVSKTVIHIYTHTYLDSRKNHVCLTYDECLGLISNIREKLEVIKEAKLGVCFHCEGTIYTDEDRYTLASGELVHGRCMERFIQSDKAGKVCFPASRLRSYDIFGFNRMYPESYDLNPFLYD